MAGKTIVDCTGSVYWYERQLIATVLRQLTAAGLTNGG